MNNPKKIEVGDVFQLSSGGSCTVTRYESCTRISIVHNDEYQHAAIVEAGNLRKGTVRNPFAKSVYRTGRIGSGIHKIKEGSKKTAAYTLWSGIIQRGHCEVFKAENPSYKDVSVHPDWHNFQTFAEWFYSQPNCMSPGFQLDKDLIIIGNREYSAKACSFMPSQINSILNDCAGRRGPLKQGVSIHRGSYIARISIEGASVKIGNFSSEHAAYMAYEKAKNKYVREMAEKYKEVLHPKVYENLKAWTLK